MQMSLVILQYTLSYSNKLVHSQETDLASDPM